MIGRAGWYYLQTKDYEPALSDLENAARLDHDYADPYAARGFIYVQLGQLDLAVKEFSEALRMNPRDGLTWARRGGAYHEIGKLDEALADYSESLRVGLGDRDYYAEVYSQKCRVFALLKEPRKALEECERSLYYRRDDPEALDNRALAHWLKGNREEAVRDLERAREIDPSRPTSEARIREFDDLF